MNSTIRVALSASLLISSAGAHAIAITATQDANTLATALLDGVGPTHIVITGKTLSGQQQTSFQAPPSLETSSGTYTNTSGTYGIGPGIVLTTGAVEERSYTDIQLNETVILSGYGDGPSRVLENSTAYRYLDANNFFATRPATDAQEVLLQPLSPFPHLDVTELVVNFDMQSGYDRVQFNVAYGTEEYDGFIGTDFIDIFAVFLNGTNIALVNGDKFNVDHPDFTAVTGTELNGLLAPGGIPLLTLSGAVNPGSNELRFIIADTQDNIYDSTVYLSGLKGLATVPLPTSIWLLGTAVAGLFGRGFAKRRHLYP